MVLSVNRQMDIGDSRRQSGLFQEHDRIFA